MSLNYPDHGRHCLMWHRIAFLKSQIYGRDQLSGMGHEDRFPPAHGERLLLVRFGDFCHDLRRVPGERRRNGPL